MDDDFELEFEACQWFQEAYKLSVQWSIRGADSAWYFNEPYSFEFSEMELRYYA